MNLILVFPEDFIEQDRVRLKGRRLKHVLDVHRAAVGDELRIGLADDRMGSGTVTMLSDAVLEMQVRLAQPPPAALPVTLILALPRPKALRRIIRSLTALGVKKLILLNAFRVEKSYWGSPLLRPELMRQEMILGLEQSRDTVFPTVLLRPLFKPFVEDELPSIAKDTLSLVAHPGAPDVCPGRAGRPVTLAVGPEGGFIPFEIEKLTQTGFSAVHCGDRILTVETAIPFLLARLF